MTASRTIADVRQRPGLFVGDTGGSGVLNLVLELLANSYDQHVAGRCSRVAIELLADATVIVEDDGPGLAADLPPLHQVLTTMSTAPTVDGHRPHIHFGAGGAGLFVVNALSERFTICTVSRGMLTTASYTRGVVSEPVATMATAKRAGTRITFRPDPQIFMHPRVPRAELARYLEDLSFLSPQLTLTTAIHGDAIAARGLAARVAIEVPCALTDCRNPCGHLRDRERSDRRRGRVRVAGWSLVRHRQLRQPRTHAAPRDPRRRAPRCDSCLLRRTARSRARRRGVRRPREREVGTAR